VELMSFEIGEYAVLNEQVGKDLPMHVGDLVQVLRYRVSNYYSYDVELATGDINPVREKELNKLTEEQKQLVTYINRGNKVTYAPTNEIVEIIKVDMLHGQVEIKFDDNGVNVVDIKSLKPLEKEIWRVVEQPEEQSLQGKFTEIANEIGQFTDMKNKQYGSSVDATQKMIEVLMERYTYDEENYLMPKSLLKHILLQVRMMDKQNRIFNNPSGEGDSESPYRDLGGYSLIGIEMTEK
jgi:hypothetical protein